ncbi:MAG: carbohydrate ABC transporter permease, partial [Clostridiales bacterium]|nr:carbohydrate ABC transporter permease [Clostridiales bacterium]
MQMKKEAIKGMGTAAKGTHPRLKKAIKAKSGSTMGVGRQTRSRAGNFMVFLVLAMTGAVLVVPLIFAIVNSLKPFDELFIYPPRLYVVRPTMDNFVDLIALCSNTWVPFTKYLFNSLFTTVAATVLRVIISAMCAYPLAKNRFPGRKMIFGVVVTALLFVPSVTFLPQYLIIANLRMINTYWALILPVLGTTFGVFLMKQFMEPLPTALLEAARIDGYSEFKILFKIVMPNVKPAWVTLVLFTFQEVWNSTGS